MEPLLEVQHLWKRYGEVVALRDCSFTLLPGRIIGLLGPNGSGKTTLLRILAGILQPDAGHVHFFGPPNPRSWIGYLPEERGLYRQRRVREQLLYLASLRNMPRQTAHQAVHSCLQRLGAAEYATRSTDELSKGMLQKVQLTAALLHRPALLLLDEPTNGLDPLAVHEFTELLRELRHEGCTVLLSTHQLEYAEQICDDVLLLHRGQILLAGSLHELKARYGHHTLTLDVHGDITPALAHIPPECIRSRSEHRLELLWPELKPATLQEFLQQLLHSATIRSLAWNEPSLREIVLKLLHGSPPG